MKVLVVRQAEIEGLLPMTECVPAMAEALAALARGDALLPLRQVLKLPGGVFAVMPATLVTPPAVGVKAITVFPGNQGTELDSHQGAVLLFEGGRGRLLAVMDATAITAIRTAAVSAVATSRLAREDAGDLAILGTGVQARTHLEAMLLARRVRRVRVFGRDPARLRAFVARAAERHRREVQAAATARQAVEGADIVCTVTSSPEPVLRGEWLAPGAHVNAVGACLPTLRELDTAAVVRSRLFVDRRESALSEAGDLLIPIQEKAIADRPVLAELGEVLLGRHPGRGSAEEVTLFKSLGLAVEDVAAAQVVYRNAERSGSGTWMELGGARQKPA